MCLSIYLDVPLSLYFSLSEYLYVYLYLSFSCSFLLYINDCLYLPLCILICILLFISILMFILIIIFIVLVISIFIFSFIFISLFSCYHVSFFNVVCFSVLSFSLSLSVSMFCLNEQSPEQAKNTAHPCKLRHKNQAQLNQTARTKAPRVCPKHVAPKATRTTAGVMPISRATLGGPVACLWSRPLPGAAAVHTSDGSVDPALAGAFDHTFGPICRRRWRLGWTPPPLYGVAVLIYRAGALHDWCTHTHIHAYL